MSHSEPPSTGYSSRLKEAVRSMAQVREEKTVRADSHLQALGNLVRDIFVAEGFDGDDVLIKTKDEKEKERRKKKHKNLTLPGYFRVTKNWDLLVVEKDILVAAVEFKSMNTSAAKNINNRVEEVLGSGTDLWAAHDAGYLGLVKPWLGYFVVLEQSQQMMAVPEISRANFPVDEEFSEKSYLGRWEMACERIVGKGVYDAACLIVSKGDPDDPFYEPNDKLGFNQFADAISDRAKDLNDLRRQLSERITEEGE